MKNRNPGVFSMGAAFLVGTQASLLRREPAGGAKIEDKKMRAYIGIRAE